MPTEPNTTTEIEKKGIPLYIILIAIGIVTLVAGLGNYSDGYSETYGGWRSNDLEKVVISSYILDINICAQVIIDENIKCLIKPCYNKLSHIQKNMPIGSGMLINFSLNSGYPCITTHLAKNNSFYGLIFLIISVISFIVPFMMFCVWCYDSYKDYRNVRYTSVNVEMA